MTVTYPDTLAEAVALLTERLAGRDEEYAAGVTVSTRSAGMNTPLPHVLVDKDVDRPNYPISARSDIRVTAYHTNQQSAIDLALLAQGLVLSYEGGTIAATRALTGPVPGYDREVELHLATFSFSATVRSLPV